jgi:glycine oxidase ThiO
MKSTQESFDIAIIGGGAVGLACAWKLAKGGASVVLFERLQTGREASFAAGGMLAPSCEGAVHGCHASQTSREAMQRLCFASRDSYPHFASQLQEESGIDIEISLRTSEAKDWREPGILFVSHAEEDPRVDVLLEHGLAATWKEKRAVYLPDDGQVDSRKLVEALRLAALRSGVEIRDNRTIRRLETEEDRVVGVSDEKETVSAGQVLLCAGAWSGKIVGIPDSISEAVRPVAGQMVQLRGERRLRHIIYSDTCYLVPRRDGRLLVGATEEEIGYCKRVTAGGVAKLLNAALELVPELVDAPLESHWAGLRPISLDGLPLLGQTSLQGLFVATGHGRNGVLLCPATAAAISELMLQNTEISPVFSPTRFARVSTAS